MNALCAQMRMEWRQQWARPFVWFSLLGSVLLAAAATVENAFGMRGFSWINGADAVATRALMLSVLGVIVAAGVMGEAMSRDRQTGTEETLLMTAIGRVRFGLGRFIPALATVLVISAAFVPGMMLGALVPGIPSERIGPLVPGHYGLAMLIYVVPNLLLVCALIYAVAARWRSQTAGFIVALGLIALYATALMLLGQDLYRHEVFGLYALLDPYGNIAGAEYSMTWTVAQNNTQFRPFAGLLLMNRLVWLGVAFVLIVVGTWGIPRFLQMPRQRALRRTGWPRLRLRAPDNAFVRMTLWELQALWRQPGVLVLMGFAAFSLWWAAASAVTYSYSLPTTDLLIHNSGYYFDKVLVVLLVWCAGDIVWRERLCHVDEVVDALPASDAARLASKTAALGLIVLLFWTLAMGVNLTYQIAQGFHDFEWRLLVVDSYLVKAPYFLWMSVLAIALQVIVRRRFIAMAMALVIYLSPSLLDALHLYYPLYRFGDSGFFWYSPMDGYGHFWRGHAWMLAYWSLACMLIWLIAWGCAARGTEPPRRIALWQARLWQARFRRGPGGALAGMTLAAFLLVGGAIIWQTRILHPWPLFDESRAVAEVEKRYRTDWADIPQPKITAITGQIDLYPDKRQAEMRGELVLENLTSGPISDMIVFFHPLLKMAEMDLQGRGAMDTARSTPHAQVWSLDPPLPPSGRLPVAFRTQSHPDPGFALHNQHDTIPEVEAVEMIGNGTSLLNLNLIPAPGYSERLEHKPAWLRRQYGLPPEWVPPQSSLNTRVAHDTTHLAWVDKFDITVTTSADQIPLHSGEMVEDLGINDGRRAIRYRATRPSRGWAEVMSARYDVYRAARPGLPPVELYYHPPHDYTLEPMSRELLDAMAYFQRHYGVPPFDSFRMAEASLHYTGFGARGGLAFVSEVMGWKTDLRRSGGEDLRTYAANLMGVSWWLDQIMPANLPGAKSVLSGLPYWSAALYLHRARGPALSREARLRDMLESYRQRARLEDAELPFAEEMKDSAMIRSKGALHVIYLAELVGQERLEAAFAGFLEDWRFRPAPYPSVTDLIAHLEADLPAAAHAALGDFFAHVSNWQLRVAEAVTWQNGSGNWQLRAIVEARKSRTEGLGVETDVPLETTLPLVAFRGDGFEAGDVLRQDWQALPGGRHQIIWELPEKPSRFGIDPYLYLPDPNPHDNVVDVRLIDAPGI